MKVTTRQRKKAIRGIEGHGHVKVADDVAKALIVEARGVDLSDVHERIFLSGLVPIEWVRIR